MSIPGGRDPTVLGVPPYPSHLFLQGRDPAVLGVPPSPVASAGMCAQVLLSAAGEEDDGGASQEGSCSCIWTKKNRGRKASSWGRRASSRV